MSTDDNAAYVDLDKQNVSFINPWFQGKEEAHG